MSELLKRVLVGVVGIPLAVAVIYFGGYLFIAVIIMVAALALHEFYALSEKKGTHPLKWLSIVFSSVFLFLVFIMFKKTGAGVNFNAAPVIPCLLILFVLTVLACQLFRRKHSLSVMSISVTLAGFMYVTMSFMFLVGVRYFFAMIPIFEGFDINNAHIARPWTAAIDDRWSAWLLLSVFVTVWICDTAAYFIGKAVGKHKLLERVSPKKTWEGAVAGFIFAVASFVGCSFFLLPSLPLVHAVLLGVIIGTAGQVGDLAESQLKRDANVKDSSNLLPGHGGALDRFDSILFAMPLVFIYMIAAAVFL